MVAKASSFMNIINFYNRKWAHFSLKKTSDWINYGRQLDLDEVMPIYKYCVQFG